MRLVPTQRGKMMKTPLKLLIGTGALLALTSMLGKGASDEEEKESDDGEDTPDNVIPMAKTGFQGSIDTYEHSLEGMRPVDLAQFEQEEPTCGHFYQCRRGDTWLGTHERSITYRALYRTTYYHAVEQGLDDPEALARRNAERGGLRKALFDLCVSQVWADELYGTYLISAKDPVGPHGRGIPLVRFCANNRTRLESGDAVMRVVPRGEPSDRGLGTPNRKTLRDTVLGDVRLSFPYLWISALNVTELLRGRVTTRGVSWYDGTTGMEPPPQVVRLGKATLR